MFENSKPFPLSENTKGRNLTVNRIHGIDAVEEIVALERQTFNGESEDVFTLATLAKIGWIWGVRDGEILIGGVEMFRSNDPEKGFIHGVLINPNYQYKGLGSQLISYAEEQARQVGITSIECTIAPTNGASLNAFINKLGYSADQFIPNCYGPGAHRLWVGRDITQPHFAFNYPEMLDRQAQGEGVYFVEDTDSLGIQQLLQYDENKVVGLVRGASPGSDPNQLCIVNKNLSNY